MAASTPVDRQVLLNDAWNRPSEEAKGLIRNVEAVQQELAKARAKFTTHALTRDIAALLDDYKFLSAKFLRFFNSRYRYIKREMRVLYIEKPPRKTDQIIADLEALAHCIKLREDIRKLEQTGRALFGSHWQAEESSPDRLRAFATWIVAFRKQLLADILTEHAVDMVSAGVSQEQMERLATQVNTAAQHFVRQLDLLHARLGADCNIIFGVEAQKASFADLLSRLELWQVELSRLQRWAQFVARRNACRQTMAQPVVDIVEDDTLEPEDVVPCFAGNLADALFRLAFVDRLPLVHFVGDLHEKKIQRFHALDRDCIRWNRQRLAAKLYESRPHLASGASPGSEVGILQGEFNRKRGHMPIRRLLSRAGGLIQKIKPCFMMSPLSIAQFCDPRTARFDVIVFDEASQVRPEDAVYDFLRSHGYEVRKQVGCAGFRVDLAVVDPSSPSRYLLGVECDGAKYHNAPVARDRDRLRQHILEGLGWRIHRIWSTDWYRNRSETESKLLDAIERIRYEEQTLFQILPDTQPQPPALVLPETVENVEAPPLSTLDDTLQAMVSDYHVCTSLGIPVQGELHEQPVQRLAEAVTQVVGVEGPVHIDEVIRRIRSMWGLKRSGNRITNAIGRAVLVAEKTGQIRRRGDFLWPAADRSISVRRRSGDPLAKIDLICDEEITEAMRLVLVAQHATLPAGLITQAVRLFGIKAISRTITERLQTLLDKLIQDGSFQRMPNGMIHLAGS